MSTSRQSASAIRQPAAKKAINYRLAEPPKTPAHRKQVEKIMADLKAGLSRLPRERRRVHDAMYDEYGLPI